MVFELMVELCLSTGGLEVVKNDGLVGDAGVTWKSASQKLWEIGYGQLPWCSVLAFTPQ